MPYFWSEEINFAWAFCPLRAFCSYRHFVSLDILSLWAFCLFRHNVFWAFYPVGHFVILGQNVFWAFSPWAFCHMWAFCHFGHFIIQSFERHLLYLFAPKVVHQIQADQIGSKQQIENSIQSEKKKTREKLIYYLRSSSWRIIWLLALSYKSSVSANDVLKINAILTEQKLDKN